MNPLPYNEMDKFAVKELNKNVILRRYWLQQIGVRISLNQKL